jgi:hypothetical protein
VYLYATAGASAFSIPAEDPMHRRELYLGLHPAIDADQVARALVDTSTFHLEEQRHVGIGDTITLLEPLWRGTRMRAFWLRAADRDRSGVLSVDGRLHIEFIMAVPLFEEEVTSLRALGEHAFWSAWARMDIPFPGSIPLPSDSDLGCDLAATRATAGTCPRRPPTAPVYGFNAVGDAGEFLTPAVAVTADVTQLGWDTYHAMTSG